MKRCFEDRVNGFAECGFHAVLEYFSNAATVEFKVWELFGATRVPAFVEPLAHTVEHFDDALHVFDDPVSDLLSHVFHELGSLGGLHRVEKSRRFRVRHRSLGDSPRA